MVDVMDKIQKIREIGKSTKERQQYINVSEVFYVWDVLVTKSDIMECIQVTGNFAEDKDLRLIIDKVTAVIKEGMASMESIMSNYGIPFPSRPPAAINTTAKLEHITDRFVYQTLFIGIQSFFHILAGAFMQSTSPIVGKTFKNHLITTMEVHEILIEYGRLKGYLNIPPTYNA
ncbi:hypothetical protein SPSYN_02559 [Sporotomaculum syntrophicum]|uniref:DUF3231 family protein n=1 Tax=Sporotomaculum syntrophicum TaxID=182264 RepID=A0A9D2WNB5_9FIRM|nr:DUF3231 family protein [Sporotomaculum syntrophicum]KAF1084155.1 hypothetical protein SPSYN_02559 [Sporotomaculum syntrophicum]